MIASIRGTVLASSGTSVVIDVGGVGYAVQVTPQHAASLRIGAEATLRTALIVRDDDLSLFGFHDADALEVFDRLRTVAGVGPKSAMAVLAAMTPGSIAEAVEREDDAAFRRVSGIGPKTAKLIIVSLTGKLTSIARGQASQLPATTVADDVLVALVGLGWPERVAAQAVETAVQETADPALLTVPSLLRVALAALGPAVLAEDRR